MPDNEYTVNDLLQYGLEQKPDQFADAFMDLVRAKAAQAVADKKFEISSSLFADPNDDGEAPEDADAGDDNEGNEDGGEES